MSFSLQCSQACQVVATASSTESAGPSECRHLRPTCGALSRWLGGSVARWLGGSARDVKALVLPWIKTRWLAVVYAASMPRLKWRMSNSPRPAHRPNTARMWAPAVASPKPRE